MLKVLQAEDSPLCLGGSSTCAVCAAVPDDTFVPSKAHADVKLKTANTIAFDLHRILVPNTMESKAKEEKNGFELVVFGQMQPHKIDYRIWGPEIPRSNSDIQYLKYDAMPWPQNMV